MDNQDRKMIRMKDIVREGDPILRQKTAEVPVPLNQEDHDTMEMMMEYLKNSQDPESASKYQLRPGVGLSANQIGKDRRMFAAFFRDEKGDVKELRIFNPKIISHSAAMVYLPEGEGCLSVDRDVKGYVPRYERIKIRYSDEKGEQVEMRLKGIASVIVQHEIDHLNGIMFYDRINKDNPFELPDGAAAAELF
ncbi:peptide deformylase [Bacillus infantis]|uniref:Peptide deformylase n=1 Tax=Bacillus infantis TaxID=324767 RepID=A0A5D4RE73_9BACI|nr:peptide deformylase [Bacillus infantis]TYS47772.1 peptide deformylase [Bacillus infantis]